jgi:putative transposase
VLDVFSRRVVGWSLGRSLQTALPLAALNQTIQNRQPGAGLIIILIAAQYASDDYVKRLEKVHMVISMSRPARPWENAYCESFMSTLKREQVSCASYAAMEDLQTQMTEFIDQFITFSDYIRRWYIVRPKSLKTTRAQFHQQV